MLPPRPPKIPQRILQLGRERVDDYAWMKDDNWQAVLRDPALVKADVREHLEAENAYQIAMMASTDLFQARLFEEMKSRVKQDDSSVPISDGEYEYYESFITGAQHPRHYRRSKNVDSDEYLLLDEDAESAGKAYFSVDAKGHSPDHTLYAWAVDEQGAEYYKILIKDLASGEILSDGPVDSTGDFVFSPDSCWLFWVWRDENARPTKVFRRPARGGEDRLVYQEPDEGMFLAVATTADRLYVLIVSQNQETSEVWIVPAHEPTTSAVVAQPRHTGLRYELDHWSDRWVIRDNANGAVDFELAVSFADIPSRETWRKLVPHKHGRLIAGVLLYQDFLVRLEREDAGNRIVISNREGEEHAIAFDEPACALSLSPGFEYATNLTRFVYQSPTTPRRWYDYDMLTRGRILRKTQDIPCGHDPALYETVRLFAAAPDGASIPITVLKLRQTALDGQAPLMLYGYGAYGIALDPTFSIQTLSLVNRGWIWATAHVRGGSDKGWGWFLNGRGLEKRNTFTDFIACAESLAAQGFGSAGRMVAYGGSAGGLLVGAVTNMRPDLWGAVIAAVPFVDVLNTMSDDTLPLTPPEWPEWGNPLIDEAAYDYISSYSPYDNVGSRPYPAIFAHGGLSDPRVTWWEPEKWISRLREHTTSGQPVLLNINMETGHGGASGRFDHLKEVARDYAFAVWAIGGTEAVT